MSQLAKDDIMNKAISLFNAGQLKKSLKETLSAKKKYPEDPFIYNFLGVLYAQIGSFEDSKKNYLKAIKLNPKYLVNHSSVNTLLIETFAENGRSAEGSLLSSPIIFKPRSRRSSKLQRSLR